MFISLHVHDFFSMIQYKMFDERKHLRKKCVIYKNGDEKCSICLSYLNNTVQTKVVTQLPCSHMFHPKCIKQWSRPSCPLCRHCFFFQHYHTIDRWNGKNYRPRNHLSLNTYPYNNRYTKSYGNLVLFELRRFQRYYKRSSFRAAMNQARIRVTELTANVNKMTKYFNPKKNMSE